MRPHVRLNAWPSRPGVLSPARRGARRFLVLSHQHQSPSQRQNSSLRTLKGPASLRGTAGHVLGSSRRQSALASRTAVNPTSPTPPANTALHGALSALNSLAPEAVNQSRLQLVLRSLESAQPVLRVGILGVGDGGFSAAKRIARLLVADPLDSQAAWESEMVGQAGAVLIRYSEEEELDAERNPLLKIVGTNSRVLGREAVEVLVAKVEEGLTVPYSGNDGMVDSVLVPVLQSPLAGSDRAGFVRFPVHRAIVVGEGVKGALKLGELEKELDRDTRTLVNVAVNLPVSGVELDGLATTNVDSAESAFGSFRVDVKNGSTFSDAWQSSGLSQLSDFLFSDKTATEAQRTRLRPALKAQIASLLTSTESSIDQAESQVIAEITSQTVPESRRERLQSVITSWSEYAHTDLRNSLTYAFESPTWRRTAFPRVLWRIDDVTFSGSEVLYSNFLVETETYLAFLTGQIGEAGDEELETKRRARFNPTKASLLRMDTLSARLRAETGLDTSVAKPWPRGIEATRQALLRTLLPSIHARAQSLVLQCLGTVGSTSALAVWYVIATAGGGLYEAGAVAGLGLVWALRRLQRLWGEERTKFESEVREQGRLVLAETEGILRKVVREDKRPQVRTEDTAEWEKARSLIHAARNELEKL
ncbi:hypothetical protein K461DRAFT_224358 [Myriangium duriaei CBS 260.36]|uniref:Mmc1 C-terminal domain-containing protein n=1 Tax=Myriangium duriaei CBS 260.36 TaxID=1168546 RepID=A0A9P4J0W2_9PEZI|nr:hypothetical protein K461DRAFT_224358 [Myriangium duriaei CBS 260.36]